MNLTSSLVLAAITAAIVAFFTTIISEPVKSWLNRNRYARERQIQNQIDALPQYITTLVKASSACSNVNSGWQQRTGNPFEYTGRAAEQIGEAANASMDIAYLFGEQIESKILELRGELLEAYNAYMIDMNAVAAPPSTPTQAMRGRFDKIGSRLSSMVADMKAEYRRIVGLPPKP